MIQQRIQGQENKFASLPIQNSQDTPRFVNIRLQ
jgi:hypothetical protein